MRSSGSPTNSSRRHGSSCWPSGRRGAPSMRRADGRVVPTVPGERVYSTPELLARERRILDQATESRDARVGVAREAMVERALRRRPTISGEQAAMVRRLTLEGAGVAVVVGEAGTGKTFALAAAREAWEASGWRVIGAALAQRAAHELEHGSGIESSTIASLLAQLREATAAGAAAARGARRGRGGHGVHSRAGRAVRARGASGSQGGARRRPPPAVGDRRRRRLPGARHAAAGDRADREPPPGGGVGARSACAAAVRRRERRARELRAARPGRDR